MSKLKEQILQSARQLFEEKGYEGVSLRTIAEHAGTTIGNLTYHYPQKEDLLVAMQIATQGDVLTQFGKMPPTPEAVLREMVIMSFLLEDACRKNSFYYCNLIRLCKDVPSLKGHVEKMRDIVFNIHLDRFYALRAAGFMRDLPDERYESVAAMYLLTVTSWLNVRNLFQDKAAQIAIRRMVMDLIYPLLSEKGKACLQDIEAHEEDIREELKKYGNDVAMYHTSL